MQTLVFQTKTPGSQGKTTPLSSVASSSLRSFQSWGELVCLWQLLTMPHVTSIPYAQACAQCGEPARGRRHPPSLCRANRKETRTKEMWEHKLASPLTCEFVFFHIFIFESSQEERGGCLKPGIQCNSQRSCVPWYFGIPPL